MVLIAETLEEPKLRNPTKLNGLSDLLSPVLAPVPLFLIQPLLGRVVRHIARARPEMFSRVTPHQNKKFLIDPLNLPFVVVLQAHPDRPSLTAYRRHNLPETDGRIAGTFLTLLDMVDGRLDGDALFFTRELLIEGDTEAVVCLRNALDDLEGSVVEDIASLLGVPGRSALKVFRKVRDHEA